MADLQPQGIKVLLREVLAEEVIPKMDALERRMETQEILMSGSQKYNSEGVLPRFEKVYAWYEQIKYSVSSTSKIAIYPRSFKVS